ncbi:phage conserved hypothetical protein, phiE125 gp8 family [Kaistia soli DSM 19436]|uniref:Phage gp6-like head-tail connector protein n=1 Tax=Kaistia soli DSM 19436 TaxID=1122133 RepID=A0A1M4UYX4_9HYPH|nr:head-tail connector protein [Kaistia soli]SHE61926.1 phage conserved hypothetical protein, phiE125 gp8 family [Kaistia soli DSM 19436]
MTTALISGPSMEPVTLADVKAHLRLDTSDDDRLLQAAIVAARVHIEAVTRRCLIHQLWRIYLDEWPESRSLPIPLSPLIAVNQVTFYDVAGVARQWGPENWRVDVSSQPARLVAKLRPQPALYDNGVEIDVIAGYGVSSIDVPAPLRQAVMVLVANWYEARGMVGHDFAGAIAPPGFEALIAPFKVRSL